MIFNEENLLKLKNKTASLKYSEYLMLKYPDKFDWEWISRLQKLSESFIEKYENDVEWVYISYTQKISDNFILMH